MFTSPSRGSHLAALTVILAIGAGCGSAGTSPLAEVPTPTAMPTVAPATAPPAPTPIATPSPTLTASLGPVEGDWVSAGRRRTAIADIGGAVELGDGRVLVVGQDQDWKTTHAELWDPTTNTWSATTPPNKFRTGFVLVGLRDGRALMAGGMNKEAVSFSSAYVFDPSTEHWSKVGLMHTARTDAFASILPDGRVLVAGGRHSTGPNDYPWSGAIGGPLAIATAGIGWLSGPLLADVDPGATGRPLATAELFDPRTGEWSKTGSMRVARIADAPSHGSGDAVTLGDGRVLIFGSGGMGGLDSNRLETIRAEIYDPSTGRFSPAPALPVVDHSMLARLGIGLTDDAYGIEQMLRLLSLPDGDALIPLIETQSHSIGMEVTRTLRYDAERDVWVEVGEPFVLYADVPGSNAEYGQRHPDGFAAPLADGLVLVAGGHESKAAELLDPVSGTWSRLPDMPAQAGSPAVVPLRDGSVLVLDVDRKRVDRPFRLVLGQ